MNHFYDMVTEKILNAEMDVVTIEDRPLTGKEWFRKHIMREKGDPRVHIEPIRIRLFDDSDPDNWKWH